MMWDKERERERELLICVHINIKNNISNIKKICSCSPLSLSLSPNILLNKFQLIITIIKKCTQTQQAIKEN